MRTKNGAIALLVIVIMIWGCIGLLLSYAATIAYAEDNGYPAPIDDGYPVFGYPVDPIGYPVETEITPTKTRLSLFKNTPTPKTEPEPVIGYPVPTYPFDTGYPEPSSNSLQLYSTQSDSVIVQFDLWAWIVKTFGNLLELMK